MGLLSVLGVIFVVLKLLELIAWSWWLVLIPFFVEIILLLGGIMGMAYLCGKTFKGIRR